MSKGSVEATFPSNSTIKRCLSFLDANLERQLLFR